MFDITISEEISISSRDLHSPLVVLGKSGQGKTVFLVQLALQLIANKQTGLLYDPYGDMTKQIQALVQTKSLQTHVQSLTQSEYLNTTHPKDVFTLVSGAAIADGMNATREISKEVVNKASTELETTEWLLIDEATNVLTDEVLKHFLDEPSPRFILSDQSLINLSHNQREMLFAETNQWVIYKTRNIDAKFLEEHLNSPTAKDIAAMQQFYFYFVDNGASTYTKGIWPTESI